MTHPTAHISPHPFSVESVVEDDPDSTAPQSARVSPGSKLRIATLLAQAGCGQDRRTGAISTPIYQTATFAHPALGESTGFDYSRTINPTRKVLEDALARLDGGVAGFASPAAWPH